MKKFVKSILCFSIALMLAIPMFIFSGCSKNYTVTVNVLAGQGDVLLKQETLDAGSSFSVKGNNKVAEGTKFEFLIAPSNGWQIKSITEDGVKIPESSYNKEGTYRTFVNVKANHKVEVEFEKMEFDVTFMCKSDSGDDFVQYGEILHVEFEETINLNTDFYGGTDNQYWYAYDIDGLDGVVYLYNHQNDLGADLKAGYERNILKVRKELLIYTNKTAAEIPFAE